MMHCANRDLDERDFILFKEGCTTAYRLVFDHYSQVLYRYVYAVTKDKFESEDVIQDTFIQLFLHKNKIETAAHIYPYLFVVAKRILLMRFRKKVVQAKYDSYMQSQTEGEYRATEEVVHFKELNHILASVQQQLPAAEKEVFHLSKTLGMTYDEISNLKGISRNTVKNQIISATKKVRMQLKKYYFLLFF